MSLWTPGGEHEVPRDRPSEPNQAQPAPGPASAAGESPQIDEAALAEALGIPSLDDLTDEQREQLEAAVIEMAEQERQLVAAPPEAVVANHIMGLYELAAIHLRQNPPNLNEASFAIDAATSLADGLEGRLGENEPTVRQALAQLQQAFVAASKSAES